MRLLIDTHAFLWFIDASPQLSATARKLIEDAGNERYLSVASVWEMAIKVSLGKLRLGQPMEVRIPQQLSHNGIALLSIDLRHTAAVTTLPFHHRDPFDRMLIAPAQVEQMSILSIDSALDAYGTARLW